MLVELYRQYREALDATVYGARPIAYDWGELPNPLNGVWLPYSEMFNEFSREIANSLNEMNDYSFRLRTWNTVIAPMNDQEKLDAVHEFVDPIATIGLNLPYVIRSRFILRLRICLIRLTDHVTVHRGSTIFLWITWCILRRRTNSARHGEPTPHSNDASRNLAISNIRPQRGIFGTHITTVSRHASLLGSRKSLHAKSTRKRNPFTTRLVACRPLASILSPGSWMNNISAVGRRFRPSGRWSENTRRVLQRTTSSNGPVRKAVSLTAVSRNSCLEITKGSPIGNGGRCSA